jgi:hypothetical protein
MKHYKLTCTIRDPETDYTSDDSGTSIFIEIYCKGHNVKSALNNALESLSDKYDMTLETFTNININYQWSDEDAD